MMNMSLEKLEKFAKGKTLILGIGNIIKGDDGAGPRFISRLKGKTTCDLLDCGEVPENYVQPIIETRPQKIVIVDAADWNGPAGAIRLMDAEEIDNRGYSTHDSSLRIFIEYLKKRLPRIEIIIIGIQPRRNGFLESLSPEVERTVDELSRLFEKAKC
jgi:hydrogenase 3 maturation protease